MSLIRRQDEAKNWILRIALPMNTSNRGNASRCCHGCWPSRGRDRGGAELARLESKVNDSPGAHQELCGSIVKNYEFVVFSPSRSAG